MDRLLLLMTSHGKFAIERQAAREKQPRNAQYLQGPPRCRKHISRCRCGVYRTADGYIAIAMTPVPRLAEVLGCEAIADETDPSQWFTRRDSIKTRLAEFLATGTTAHWLSLLVPTDIWATEVLDWTRLIASQGFRDLNFTQTLRLRS